MNPDKRMWLVMFAVALLLASCAGLRGMGIQEVYGFPAAPSPRSPLILGSDGAFYGTTMGGGANGHGSVFRVTTNGVLTTVASFAFTNGASPMGGLVQGKDGAFYGTTHYGGISGPGTSYGTVFRVTTNGALTTLLSFDGVNGRNPFQTLFCAADGAFYGRYGAGNGGAIFRITAGGMLTRLVVFDFAGTNGNGPNAPLVQGADGALYGTTAVGGPGGPVSDGTVFRVTTNGVLTTLAAFARTNGAHSWGGLVWGDNGVLYGTTSGGGIYGGGTVFQVTTNGVLTTVASLENSHGTAPYAGLVRGRDGAFYGTTSANGEIYNYGTVIRVTTNGVLTVLAHFNYGNGAYPSYASLAEGNDGAFYGTTEEGGNNGCGVVFRVTTNGLLTAVASFTQPSGMNPCGPMVQATDGAFYGTTVSGGDHNFGSVFRMTSSGVVTTLVSFDDTNGAFPQTGLMQGRDGALFGTTAGGFDSRFSSFGTVFRLTLNGQLTTLVKFTGYNGRAPQGPLVQGTDGALYGTAGTDNYGMIYRLTTSGTFTVLAAFDGVNGASPRGSLVEGSDGAFYGTTAFGGANDDGTVFRVTTNGELKALLSFNTWNGTHPLGGLILGSDGALYGTTLSYGGVYSEGTVFRVTTNGLLTTLATFNAINGGHPRSRLLQGSDGALYGMTTSGGSADLGTVFRVTTNGNLTTLASFDFINGASSSYASSVQVFSGLTKGHDGTIYGTAFGGGSRGGGNIFRVDLSSVMQWLTRQSHGWQVRFIGLPEVVYQVQRAQTVAGPWNTLGNIAVGTNGLASYVDGDLPANHAFYRTVQP